MDPIDEIEAFLYGVTLGDDFAAVLNTFTEERMKPAAQFIIDAGGDPRLVLPAFASLLRTAAEAIEKSPEFPQ